MIVSFCVGFGVLLGIDLVLVLSDPGSNDHMGRLYFFDPLLHIFVVSFMIGLFAFKTKDLSVVVIAISVIFLFLLPEDWMKADK